MRNAKRADILLQEAERAERSGHAAIAAYLTKRARDYLLPDRPKRVDVGIVSP